MTKVITSIVIQKDGNFTIHGVAEDDIVGHIMHYKKNQPSTALFINGKCEQKGRLGNIESKIIERIITSNRMVETSITENYKK